MRNHRLLQSLERFRACLVKWSANGSLSAQEMLEKLPLELQIGAIASSEEAIEIDRATEQIEERFWEQIRFPSPSAAANAHAWMKENPLTLSSESEQAGK